ncbi:MAG: hypothetical protein KJZ90_15420, partial [Rhodocyclaceae bacterium]|nr:hypothetical protein [Rhodocyclaceae bacterium]
QPVSRGASDGFLSSLPIDLPSRVFIRIVMRLGVAVNLGCRSGGNQLVGSAIGVCGAVDFS